jgi:ribosomal protein L22
MIPAVLQNTTARQSLSLFATTGRQPAPFFNLSRKFDGRVSAGSFFKFTRHHASMQRWYKCHWYTPKPDHIEHHGPITPRIYLDRHIYKLPWLISRNLPDETRWEKVLNSQRYAVERVHWVEEDGFQRRVNWKLYSDRVNAELQASVDALPLFSLFIKGVPRSWRKMDMDLARLRGLSVREAIAQCRLSSNKGENILFRALEMLQRGAETKGLDKERLRLGKCGVLKGKTDKQFDLRSKGYYAWRTKRTCSVSLTAIEDPEMRLPDRTLLPYSATVALRRAGVPSENVVLDVPAITAEGI